MVEILGLMRALLVVLPLLISVIYTIDPNHNSQPIERDALENHDDNPTNSTSSESSDEVQKGKSASR